MEELKEELKKALDEYCDCLDVMKKYGRKSEFRKNTGCYIGYSNGIIVDGLFALAEAVGEKPVKGTQTMIDDDGDIKIHYSFKYRGYTFWDYVKVGNIGSVVG